MAERKASRDQKRAQAAYRAVSDAKSQAWRKDYGRQCLRLPALIHQCGLCQAIAFFQAKGGEVGDKKGKEYFHQVLQDLAVVSGLERSAEKFAERARSEDMKTYQWMTGEAMASAQWLKRYAEAVLKVEPGGEDDR